MNKVAWVVAVTSVVAACKAKTSTKAQEPEKVSAGSAAAAVDTKWVERLAEFDAPSKLSLEMTAGLVGIKADGSLYIGKPPTAGAPPLGDATPAKIDQLVKTLGISPVVPRSDDELAMAEGSGSGDAGAENHLARLAHPSQASGAPAPAKRATSVFAIAHPYEVTAGVIVFAEAGAPAGRLVDVLTQTGGFVAVRKGQELGALPLSFDRKGPPAITPEKSWIEVRVGKTIDVENVPSKATPVESIDKLAEAMKDAKAVDVLVGPETTVQELMNAIGKLRAAEVGAFGFGHAPAPGSPEAAARGEQGPRVLAWDYQTRGQGEAAGLRAAFDGALEPVRACYAKALEKKADLAGTAQLQMLVSENGSVGKIEVVGAPPALVQCVTAAVKAAKYPATNAAGVIVTALVGFVPTHPAH